MRINKSELSKKIGQLKGIVPSRTTIEALKGVLCSDGYLIASDTNLTVKAKLEGMEEETEPFIIPAKAFDFIGSLPDGELEVSVSKGNIQGEYFKYKKMFMSGEMFTIIDRRVLMEAINRARLCGSAEDKTPVIMDMSGDTIGLTYRSTMADFHEEIPVIEPFEKDLKIAFDPRLMMDSLKAFECDTVTLELTSAKQPALIKADDSDMTALVLPVNFKEA